MSTPRPERRPVDRRTFLTATGSLAALTLAGCGGGAGAGTTTPGGHTKPAAVPEADLYRRALGTGFFRGGERDTIQTFGEQEQGHVDVLTQLLSKAHGRASGSPQTTIALDDREGTLGALLRLENLAASAYLGQLHRVKDRNVLAVLQSIHTVEGRHGATLALILGKPITPTGAFAQPENMASVLQVVDNVYLA